MTDQQTTWPPPAADRRGEDPAVLAWELLDTISQEILLAPRSQQKLPGPSELGNPCDRALFHKLAGTPPVNTREKTVPNWRAQIGTAVHAWLDDTFTQTNQYNDHNSVDLARWLGENRVDVGTIAGKTITGSCDLYDKYTACVVDWKTTTKAKIKSYRRSGPGPAYRVQAHMYGRGWTRQGRPVDTVMIVFLPRDGELTDTYVWWEPYQESVAVAGLARAEALAAAAAALGPAGAAHIATADSYCPSCPMHQPGATDLATACPGHTPSRHTSTDPILSLIPEGAPA